ncbi:DUF1449 family protein [Chondromyces apiculatus]|uniref:DUF1449 family protein n=1 Tax=Chondromyces apiculatus DSM 436 TaxID=1192034 RepID=A0A017ST71_9BACT|nr:DUF1449 family protein [Chondromyces apiculatus]EYF00188.1 Hypothetical protein CAP_1098 [Chondromyces apiculatus DSM 436]
MIGLVDASLTFPTVLFTGVLALALIYWFFVVLGALDMDVLGGADGHAEGALDGVTKGALEGVMKGGLDGVAKGTLEGMAKGAGEVVGGESALDGEGGLAGLMGALHLKRVPATVALTLTATFGWLISVLGETHAAPLWTGAGMPGWLFRVGLLLVSLLVALPLASLVARPLGGLFVTQRAQSLADLVGKVVVISTGRVDERFGQALLQDGGAGLILNVRSDAPGVLRQGDRAILVNWDAEKESFAVEPMDDLLVERRIQQLAGAERGASGGAGDGARGKVPGDEEAAEAEAEATAAAAQVDEEKAGARRLGE